MFWGRRKYVMDQLLGEIKIKQQNMIECGLKQGFTHAETIRVSQELDMLILEYQRHKEKMDKSSKFMLRVKRSGFVRKFTASRALIQSFLTGMIKL